MSALPTDAAGVLSHLVYDVGLKITLTRTGRLSLKPRKALTPEIMDLIRPHHDAIVTILREEHAVPARVRRFRASANW